MSVDYSLLGQLKAKAKNDREEHAINPVEDPFRELRMDEEIYLSVLYVAHKREGYPLATHEVRVKSKLDNGPILHVMQRLHAAGFVSYTRVKRSAMERLTAWSITEKGIEKLASISTKVGPDARKLLRLLPQPSLTIPKT